MYKNFLPDEYVKDIFQISPEALKDKGIKGIITDLDNTLVEWDRPEATPEIMEWVRMMQEAGLQVTILSNNNQSRVESFCGPLGTPFICDARKPLARNFRKALDKMGLAEERSRHGRRSADDRYSRWQPIRSSYDSCRPCSKLRRICDEIQ